ncbi:MAG: HupE/UreJ family protein [Novosphingobium sp.]|nr:HupE/UreJ family protein [Novosphingobium sp.]
MSRFARFFTLLFLALIASPSRAHDALPIALTLEQVDAQAYSLRIRFPPAIPEAYRPVPDVSPPCQVTSWQSALLAIRCPDATPPEAITLDWPGRAGNAPIMLRVTYQGGQQATTVSPPGATRLALPERQTPGAVFTGYFRSGIEHIFGGADHLLFLVCLMLIARRPARIAWTVTGFTLGHAVTISLASLDLVRIDSGVVEVLIALSIVFAASEIVRGRRDDLMWRKPVLVAALFGLLHGLGFAGALREIGLPQQEVLLSLLAFNLGIEAGQIAFVGLLLLAFEATRHLSSGQPGPVLRRIAFTSLAAWPIGIVASLWFFERLSGL